MKRRMFLRSAFAGLSALALNSYGKPKKDTDTNLTGFLYGVGPRALPAGERGQGSLLVKLDLKTGKLRSAPVKVAEGHGTVFVGKNLIGVVGYKEKSIELFEKSKLSHAKSVKVSGGLVTTGHAISRGDYIIYPARPKSLSERKCELIMYDWKNDKVFRKVDIPADAVHDICFLNDHEVAVASFPLEEISEGYVTSVKKAALFIVDVEKGSIKSKILGPPGYAFSHLLKGNDGNFFASAIRGRKILAENKGQQQDRVYSLSESVFGDDWLGGVLMEIDSAGNKKKEIWDSNNLLSRVFSMVSPKNADKLFVLGTLKNSLGILKNNTKNFSYQGLSEFGLYEPHGICELPGRNLIAISGRTQGVAIFDVDSLKRNSYFDVRLPYVTHLSFSES